MNNRAWTGSLFVNRPDKSITEPAFCAICGHVINPGEGVRRYFGAEDQIHAVSGKACYEAVHTVKCPANPVPKYEITAKVDKVNHVARIFRVPVEISFSGIPNTDDDNVINNFVNEMLTRETKRWNS